MEKNQKEEQPIDNFNGYFGFLNNDYPCWVLLDGTLYPSVTTAYQASRTNDSALRQQINQAETFQQLTDIASKIKNPADWLSRRYKVMESLVRDKFKRNRDIREKLSATGARKLINTYPKGQDNERYWGTVSGKGSNSLGKILQTIREEIRKGTDTERWLHAFNLEKDSLMWPKISLRVDKGGQAIDKLNLLNKPFFTFGRQQGNDFVLEHQSISRQHACLFIDNQTNVCLVDLASTEGTFINNVKLQPLRPKVLSFQDVIIFGKSTRKYTYLVDTREVEAYAKKRTQQVREELEQIDQLKKNTLSNDEIRSRLGFRINDCLLVENIPPYTSIRKLKDLFGEYARVKDINILIDKKTGKEVGTAIISFEYQKEVQEIIIKRLKFEVNGRSLAIKLFDRFEASKVIESYSVAKKERKSRSRSRSRQRKRR